MLLNDDKKKSVSLIISKIGKESKAPEKDGELQDDSMPKEAAAEELLAAIESKSAKGVVEALSALMELCSEAEEESSDEPAPSME